MVSLKRPMGAISDSLITSISIFDDKFYVYDRAGNKLETTSYEYERLKKKGVEERHDYIERIKSQQLSQH